MPVTLADVAARAGVSPVTASRALRAPGKLTPAALARVEAAMRELGYVPNLVASALASARTQAVAILVPTIASAIFASTVEGASAILEPCGYAVLLAQSGYDPAREEQALRALLARRPEALVMVGAPATAAGAAMLRQAGVRVVETWELPDAPIDAAVGFDNRAVGEAVGQHLAAQGRRRLAFLGSADRRSLQRFAGFADAARAAGLPAPPQVMVAPPGSADAAAKQTAELGDADGVFTSTDAFAVGVLGALRCAGRRVPEEVAVIGLGDLEIGHHVVPTLSTVRIDGRRIGETAAEIVLGARDASRVDLGFELIRRGSG
jgi:LacI family gluconate utilization system Gnt-I transcriptional repressor